MSMQPTGYNLPTNSKAPDASIRFPYNCNYEELVSGGHHFWTIMGEDINNRSLTNTSYEHATQNLNQLMHYRAHQSEY